MASSQIPLVLENITLPDFVQYILGSHGAPSTLIVCSSRDTFLEHLHHALEKDTDHEASEQHVLPRHPWLTPTLRSLASSRSMKLVFCPELEHLRAYLAAYMHSPFNRPDDDVWTTSIRSTRTLAILNPIQLHRPTSVFSAQGLNRTFAGAVEATHGKNSRLVIAECPADSRNDFGEHTQMHPTDLGTGARPAGAVTATADASLWDEEASILNVTTKSFGAGERGWVGRTVKVRAVAGRWCIFRDMSAAHY